jgi:tetratricopeptide (TPR) repeat protein
LAKHGAGNVYLEIFRAELVKYGRCDRAVDYLAKAVHAEPDNPDASSQLAGVLALAISSLRSTGRDVPDAQLRFAKRIALRARELNPHNYSPYSALGILCDNEGKHEEARRWFAQARNKGDPVWQIEMCTSYGMEGRFEEALHEIEQVVAQGELFAWLVPYWHGKSLFAVGRYAEATPPLLLAFHLRGLRYDLMLSVSDSLYMQGRFLSSSLFHCLEALTLWPVNKKRSGRLLAEAVVHTLVFLLTRISRFAPPLTRHIKPVLKFQ